MAFQKMVLNVSCEWSTALHSYSHVHITHTRSALYSFSLPALYLLKKDLDSALGSSHFYLLLALNL
jgi:hypothetical protein